MRQDFRPKGFTLNPRTLGGTLELVPQRINVRATSTLIPELSQAGLKQLPELNAPQPVKASVQREFCPLLCDRLRELSIGDAKVLDDDAS